MFKELAFWAEKKETTPIIHPDFKVRGDIYDQERNLRWSWNWDQLKDSPKRKKFTRVIKLAFPFDEVGLLDNCPFMCKVGENIGSNHETKYYGFAYAIEEDAQALVDWGQRFPHAKLMTNLESLTGVTTEQSNIEYVKREEEK
jgi:hypothetical protein